MIKFISSKVFILLAFAFTYCSSSNNKDGSDLKTSFVSDENSLYPADIIYFSQDFFLAVRYNDPLDAYIDTLSKINPNSLENDLDSHNK